MARLDLSLIVTSCERSQELAHCLSSIAVQSYQPREVWIADDASSNPAIGEVARQFPAYNWLWNQGSRLGYTANCNRAIRRAKGEWLLLLNDDLELEPDFLEAAAPVLEKAPAHVGLAAPKIFLAAAPLRLDNTGHRLYPDGLNRGRGRLAKDRGQYDGAAPLFPSGAACFLRRSMLSQIGLLDESFFMYGEDADLGLRARLAGWDCLFLPAARGRHGHGASRGGYSDEVVLLIERNRLLLLLKNLPLTAIALAPLFTSLRYGLSLIAAFLGRGAAGEFARRRSLGALFKIAARAHFQAARRLPATWAARQRQRPLRRLSLWQTWRLLAKHFLPPWEIAFKP